MHARIGWAGLLTALLSCDHTLPPGSQVLLTIDTDAPLPSGAVTPLFDSLRIDVFEPGAQTPCSQCSHTFALDQATVNAGNASIGIPVTAGVSGYLVRARLYRAIDTLGGEPNPDSTIDVTAALPVVSEGITTVTLFLHTDDVANPVGSLGAPAAVTAGSVVQGHAGTWPGAEAQACSGSAGTNEVCVPGGAYWMGNPNIVYGDAAEANRERLVVLSPFYMTAHEVTVAEFRARGVGVGAVLPWTTSTAGTSFGDWCTYTQDPSANDSLPVNCLSWATARAYCRASGADLPTEAQYEYVLGALHSALYVWGGDEPTCTDARYARAGFGMSLGYGPSDCRSGPSDFGGVVAANAGGSGRDMLMLSGGTIEDLAGNLEEWALDKWEAQGGPCWGTGVFTNPMCDDATATSGATRGAGWLDPAVFLHAAYRSGATLRSATWIGIGFRCARPG